MGYLGNGRFPLQEGVMVGMPVESQGVLLSWGMWNAPEADNDDLFELPPETA